MTRPGRNRRAVAACIATVALAPALAVAGATAAQAITTGQSVKRAADWLAKSSVRSKMSEYSGVQADALDALVAARRAGGNVTGDEIRAYADAVEGNALDYSNTAGATGKLILAAVSSGRNPRCFGAKGEELDLLGLLGTYYDGRSGQYGDTSFDQALAMLGVAASGQAVPSKARAFVLKQKGANGWGFSLSRAPGDDVDSTAMILQAMRAAGEKRTNAKLKAGLSWLRLQRNGDGGFNPGGSGKQTQANSTALAVMAARAMGSRDARALAQLKLLQLGSGAFGSFKGNPGGTDNQAVATVDALVAVAGAKRPVKRRASPPKSSCG